MTDGDDGLAPTDKLVLVFTGTEFKALADCTDDDLRAAVAWARRLTETDPDARARLQALLERN